MKKNLFIVMMLITLIMVYSNENLDNVFTQIQSENCISRTRILSDNHDAWYTRWKLISDAKSSIDVTYFQIEDNIFGKAFLGLLLKKAEEGLKIKLMLDNKGSGIFSFTKIDYLEELAAHPNVKVKIYNSIIKSLPDVFKDLRFFTACNHDKIIIVDNEYSITGGRNISYEYFNYPNDGVSWRDMDVLIQSKGIAQQLKNAFEEEFENPKNWKVTEDFLGNWDSKRGRLIYAANAMERWMVGDGVFPVSEETKTYERRLKNWKAHKKNNAPRPVKPVCEDMYNEEISKFSSMVNYYGVNIFNQRGISDTKILDKHSFLGKSNYITDNICDFIDAAEEEIILQNPYIILTDKAWAALKRASERGVKIILHTNSPKSTDFLITQVFFIEERKRILEEMPTCKIYVFNEDVMLHAKLFVFDKKISGIGTYNLDPMSEDINSEVMCVINNDITGENVAEKIYQDVEDSVEIKKDTPLSLIATKEMLTQIKLLKSLKKLRPLF